MTKKEKAKIEAKRTMVQEAIKSFEDRGIDHETVVNALKEAFEAPFKKGRYSDTRVESELDEATGTINVYVVKKVLEDDDVVDDNLEIELSEAKEVNPDVKVGDDFKIKYSSEELIKKDIHIISAVLRQKIKEVENKIIYDKYLDKQGELIRGTVEKIEDRYTLVNIDNILVTLPDSQKIGNETFSQGQQIAVYLTKVESETGGTKIQISRSDPGFLKRLFEESVPDIFDGTVVINNIARIAGKRSKIAVSSTDDNVDPVGSCIGRGGSTIQAICNSIGTERIDIVKYSEYPGLYIAEALKPAKILRLSLNENEKSAIAVVSSDDYKIAIGKGGINASLAVRLTGWKIDIKSEEDAALEGITGLTLDEMNVLAKPYILDIRRKEALKRRQELLEQTRIEEESKAKEETSLEVKETTKEETVPEVKEEVKKTEPIKEEKPAQTVVEYNPVQMQPKISLKDLEEQIEEEKKKKTQQPIISKKKFVKEESEEKEEKAKEPEKKNIQPQMAIYSDEELAEIESEEAEEEENAYDDEVDYDDYDKYYEDK